MGHVAGGRGRTLGGTPGGVSSRSDQPARHGEVADQFDLQIGRPAVTRARIAALLAPAERRSLVGMAIVIPIGIVKAFRRMRHEVLTDDALGAQLANRGILTRVLAKAMRAVRKPWQMYPIGLAFGLGFDTATEVSLLVLAGGAAAFSLPWYAVLTLPILFAAGMSLLDTVDGCFMNFAYGWAFSRPARKIFYNITVTGVSVAVALIIGTLQLMSILVDSLGLSGALVAYLVSLDLSAVGVIVTAGFIGMWVLALVVWRFGRIEERWTRRLQPTD